MSRAVAGIYVRHADESLRKHQPDVAAICGWCAAVWRRQEPYPCLAAQIAIEIKRRYGI